MVIPAKVENSTFLIPSSVEEGRRGGVTGPLRRPWTQRSVPDRRLLNDLRRKIHQTTPVPLCGTSLLVLRRGV